ncbi:MAG: hypothetical protein BWY11_01622 [Firmicutes bacterium ADurb.Bin182]|nr:MAG: hypothetical protein BWY11_01622 [Firmicutes bacterium ADurb.Bin182]
MKRFICTGLAVLFMLFAAGCTAPASANTLATATSFVAAAEGLLKEAREIIDWQIEESTKEMEEYEQAIKNGEAYENDDSIDEDWEKSVQLAECAAKMNALAEAFSKIEKTGDKDIDLTVDATAHYLGKAKSALADLMEIVVFYFEEYEALRPFMEFPEIQDDTDYMVYTEKLWDTVNLSIQNLKSVDCPPFMRENYEKWIEQFGAYKTLCEDLYYATSLIDPLRINSCTYRADRISVTIDVYAKKLTNDFNLQYGKVGERIDGPITTLGNEIKANCEKLIKGGKDVSYSYLTDESSVKVTYEYEDTIFPSLYRSLDSLITFAATSENGEADVLVSVEVPGFTQLYEQKFTLSEQITQIHIRPPLMTGDLSLNSEKDAQLVFSVQDLETKEYIVKDSKSIKLMSKYDVVWWTEQYGDTTTDNILAWMTPESPSVLQLKRDAVDYLSRLTKGKLDMIQGYQNAGFSDITDNTFFQAAALMGALSDVAKVRYNNAAFSMGEGVHQRVMLPDYVLESRSGICIETSLVIASALQSAGMHVMLIFPPGHAQVAVEAWPETGDYFLIETTMLPMEVEDIPKAIMYLTKEQWFGYLDGTAEYSRGRCYVLDCDLGKKLGIVPLSN